MPCPPESALSSGPGLAAGRIKALNPMPAMACTRGAHMLPLSLGDSFKGHLGPRGCTDRRFGAALGCKSFPGTPDTHASARLVAQGATSSLHPSLGDPGPSNILLGPSLPHTPAAGLGGALPLLSIPRGSHAMQWDWAVLAGPGTPLSHHRDHADPRLRFVVLSSLSWCARGSDSCVA